MNNPDDGGPAYPTAGTLKTGSYDAPDYVIQMTGGISVRARFAMQFAAAWLPIVAARGKDIADFHLSDAANAKGIAMADDLIRRLRESA